MKTYVISTFTCCGKSYFAEKYKDEYDILDLKLIDFKLIKRKRTEEELKRKAELWDSEPHLMPSEGYINLIKDDLICINNENYMDDFIKTIKSNLGKMHFIFVDYDLEASKALEEHNIDYITILPKNNLLCEWIGRVYFKYGTYKLKLLEYNWEHLKNIESETHGKNIIYLNSNEYIENVINNIFNCIL